MITAGKATMVRSVRLPRELNEGLEKNAKTKGVNVNTLVSSMITKYLEWDSYAARYGYVTLPSEVFVSILADQKDERIAAVARQLGPRLVKDLLRFWFKSLSIDAFLDYATLLSRYSGQASFEVDAKQGDYTLTIRHQLGEKWSIFVSNLYEEGLKGALGIQPRSEVSKNQVIISWRH